MGLRFWWNLFLLEFLIEKQRRDLINPAVMTQQYVGHMTEDRYDWIAQFVEHPPGTR